jgi:hypothetical protein
MLGAMDRSGPLQSVCVFLGSQTGADPAFARAARELGGLLARRGVELVYGGSHLGCMGELAAGALAAGGRVVGVMPRALVDDGRQQPGLSETVVVESLGQRKRAMALRAQGFIALPGGLGTLEELCEVATWAQLGWHAKPCGVLDVAGYYAPLAELLRRAGREGFLRPEHQGLVMIRREPAELLAAMEEYQPPRLKRVLKEVSDL